MPSDAHELGRGVCASAPGNAASGCSAIARARSSRSRPPSSPHGICGVDPVVSGPGRKLGDVIREQLQVEPGQRAGARHPHLPRSTRWSAAKTVDVTAMHPALQKLFAPQVQGFLIDILARDPAQLAKTLKVPLLIVQGERDLQVSAADARALAAAQPKAQAGADPDDEPRAEGRGKSTTARRTLRPTPTRRCRSTARWSMPSPTS